MKTYAKVLLDGAGIEPAQALPIQSRHSTFKEAGLAEYGSLRAQSIVLLGIQRKVTGPG